jgi:uncharacterized protein
MFQKSLLIAAIAVTCCATAQAQSTPAKKELVARILKVQQPGMEMLARSLLERPAVDVMDRAGAMIPERVAADKRETVARDIEGDVRRFLEETVPLVRDRAVRLAPSTVGALLEEKLTEDELKQVVGIMESPAFAKFQALGGDMQKVLVEKLVAEMRPQVDAKVRAMEESVAKRLGLPVNAGGQAPGAPAAAAPARPAASRR